MNVIEKHKKEFEEALRRLVAKCPTVNDDALLSDIYVMLQRETGEIVFTDDDDRELSRSVVEGLKSAEHDWTDEELATLLQQWLGEWRDLLDTINFVRPYSFVLIDEDRETLADLYLMDDDTILLPGELMEGLDQDLDDFLKKLMEED